MHWKHWFVWFDARDGKSSTLPNSKLIEPLDFLSFQLALNVGMEQAPRSATLPPALWFNVHVFTKQVQVEVQSFVLRGSPGCCLVLSASKKNWCYLLKRKVKIVFATENFLCACSQPVHWQHRAVAVHGCASSHSSQNTPCTVAGEIPSRWSLWSQIKVNLSSRKHDRKHNLTTSFTFSFLPWNGSLCLSRCASTIAGMIFTSALRNVFISCHVSDRAAEISSELIGKCPIITAVLNSYSQCWWILLLKSTQFHCTPFQRFPEHTVGPELPSADSCKVLSCVSDTHRPWSCRAQLFLTASASFPLHSTGECMTYTFYR